MCKEIDGGRQRQTENIERNMMRNVQGEIEKERGRERHVIGTEKIGQRL